MKWFFRRVETLGHIMACPILALIFFCYVCIRHVVTLTKGDSWLVSALVAAPCGDSFCRYCCPREGAWMMVGTGGFGLVWTDQLSRGIVSVVNSCSVNTLCEQVI
ncbi:hypothetical protein IV203_013086 [Nitzschia inconspicua]|uniref:Uncharacterized protein n=1 Tax=Nitzschia inconspicua TaxID=303405 RepID=A0A9K3Q7S8_9STRA|nr:hypothetical protein IV203_013086 [Nitzschia inconspicua]